MCYNILDTEVMFSVNVGKETTHTQKKKGAQEDANTLMNVLN